MNFQWLGLSEYFEALAVQEQHMKRAQYFRQATVLGLEHPTVITLGKRAQKAQDILRTDKELNDLFIQTVKVDRGGQATLHSPGQLVIYPIIPLKTWKLGAKDYVCLLQKTTQEFLKSYGLDSKEVPGAGLETKQGKIAFIGLRIENGISKHGLSININNDLKLFQMIKPCGSKGLDLDSFQKNNLKISTKEAFEKWAEIFFNKTKKYQNSGTNTAFLEA